MSGEATKGKAGTPGKKYPRPKLAIDVVLISVGLDGSLLTAAIARPDQDAWALPGTYVHEGESAEDAAARALRDKAMIDNAALEQLHTFSDPGRDSRDWVVSVAYFALVPLVTLAGASIAPGANTFGVRVDWEGESGGPAHLAGSADGPAGSGLAAGMLAFDHADILGRAVLRLRGKAWYSGALLGLVEPEFTLAEIQVVYEAVLGRKLSKSAFRRRILASGLIAPTGTKREGPTVAFRPPALYRAAERKEPSR